MTTYQLQRKILDAGLSMSEAFIGFVYALHLNKKTGEIKVKQEVIAHKCGCSVSTVKRAVKALCLAGIWQVQKRRGAAAIIPICGNTGKNTGTDSSLVTPNKSHRWTIISTRDRTPTRMNPDIRYSTRFEEIAKFDETQYQKELRRNGTNF